MAGFTLVEAIVTMVIIAILSTIALPSYIEYIHKGRRADAKTGLLTLQMEQEKFRANCPSYATKIGGATDCGGSTLQGSTSSPDGHYTLSIASARITSYNVCYTKLLRRSVVGWSARFHPVGCLYQVRRDRSGERPKVQGTTERRASGGGIRAAR